jgi:hypothetical protein
VKRRGNDWVHNHDDSVNTQRVRETTPKENQPLFDLDERDARKGLSPKSLNRRECTPRKKRMQEIFDVPHENFLFRDYFLHEFLRLACSRSSLYAFGLTGALTAG